jgi:hypothetical protein
MILLSFFVLFGIALSKPFLVLPYITFHAFYLSTLSLFVFCVFIMFRVLVFKSEDFVILIIVYMFVGCFIYIFVYGYIFLCIIRCCQFITIEQKIMKEQREVEMNIGAEQHRLICNV